MHIIFFWTFLLMLLSTALYWQKPDKLTRRFGVSVSAARSIMVLCTLAALVLAVATAGGSNAI